MDAGSTGELPADACEAPEAEVPPLTYVVVVVLAIMSGLFSGLNLGLLGLDVKNLELLMQGPFADV